MKTSKCANEFLNLMDPAMFLEIGVQCFVRSASLILDISLSTKGNLFSALFIWKNINEHVFCSIPVNG